MGRLYVRGDGKVLVNEETNFDQSAQRLILIPDGRLSPGDDMGLLSDGLTSDADLYARSGGEFVANTAIAGDQKTPTVSPLASGGFVIVWTDAGTPGSPGQGVTAQVFDAAGNKLGAEIVVNATAAFNGNPVVVGLTGGGFAVEWSDTSNASNPNRIQMFDSSGTKAGSEMATSIGAPSSPVVHSGATLAGNQFVLVTQNGAVAQIFDATGAKVAGTLSLTDPNFFAQAEVAALPNGGFIMVGVQSNNKLGLQMFDANGTKIGAQIEFGESYNHPNAISVSGLSNGGFALAWHSESSDIIWARAFDQAGDPASDIFKANTTGENVSQANVVGTADGQFLVTWTVSSTSGVVASDIRGQLFDASGNKLGAEFLVSQQTDEANRDHGYSDAALLASGNLITVWQGSGPGDPRTQPYPNWDHGIRGQIFTPVATPVLDIVPSGTSVNEAAVQNLAVLQLSTSSAAINATYSYQLMADSTGGAFSLDGNNLILADSSRLDWETASNLSVTIRSTDNGGNVIDEVISLSVEDDVVERRYAAGPESRVSNQTSSEQVGPAIAVLDNGGFVVTWTDTNFSGDGTGYAIKAQLYDAEGAMIGGEFLVNSWTSGIQEDSAVTALAGGSFVVTWTSDMASTSYDIRGQVYTSSGVPVGSEFDVNSTTAGFQSGSEVSALNGGGFVVSWVDSTPSGGDLAGTAVRLQMFDAAGVKTGAEQLVNTSTSGNQLEVTLAPLAGGGFVATWTDASGLGGDASSTSIKGQRFDGAGSKLGSEFLVNTQTTGQQSQSAALALGDGFAVTWTDQGRVKAQIFDALGNKLGGEITVVSSGASAAISPIPGDGFIVSWTSNDLTKGDASAPSILAQMFDAAGHRLGSTFLVNHITAGAQYTSDLATMADGTVAAVWVDESRNSFLGDIELRLFGPTQPGIFGTPQADTLNGAAHVNFIYALAGDDVVNGGDFRDVLYGEAGNDVLHGGGGDDYLAGGAGNDMLDGGAGNDIYAVEDAGDSVIETAGQGNDRVFASLSYTLAAGVSVEMLTTDFIAGTSALNLTGNALAQTIIGNNGANVLNGGGGADTLKGLGGNDQYVVDSLSDVIIEGAGGGDDTVFAKSSYALVAGVEIEILRVSSFSGTSALDLTGNALAQTIIGNNGANILNGGGGDDVLQGLGGNDQYVVDSLSDVVIEGAGGGDDTVFARSSYALGAGVEVETLRVSSFGGTTALDLTGNGFAQTIIGNAGANILNGGGGDDVLQGLGGADTFAFTTALGSNNVDAIMDFATGTDKIQLDDAVFTAIGGLGALDPNAFFAGAAAHDADDRIVYDQASGNLYYDADGSDAGAAILFANLHGQPTIAASDFSVI